MPFLAGQKVRVSELNELGGGGTGGTPTGGYAMMTGDVAITSSTTLTDATGLTFALSANATYAFHGWLLYTAGTTGDIKFRPSVPSGASGYWSLVAPANDQSPVASNEYKNYGNFAGTDLGSTLAAAGTTTTTQRVGAIISGYIITSSTAGDFDLLVAQNTSNATASTLRTGSWLRMVRIA